VLLIRPDAKVNRAASSSSLADVRARSLALDVSGAGASGGEAAGRARVYSDRAPPPNESISDVLDRAR
jgi:hypothetical protein